MPIYLVTGMRKTSFAIHPQSDYVKSLWHYFSLHLKPWCQHSKCCLLGSKEFLQYQFAKVVTLFLILITCMFELDADHVWGLTEQLFIKFCQGNQSTCTHLVLKINWKWPKYRPTYCTNVLWHTWEEINKWLSVPAHHLQKHCSLTLNAF